MHKYCVPIVYRGQANFIVEASTPERAKSLARLQFNDGEAEDICGNEWEHILSVGEPEEVK